MSAPPPTPSASETLSPEGRKAVLGAWLGFFVDMFDIYLPILALAPAEAYFQATDVSKGTAAIITAMIFAATLLGRPIGAMLFGHLADKVGRRRTAIMAVTGFGIFTVLIAALPGYETLGLTAVVLLILLRFVDGICLGGEYTSATPLALENAPQPKRGLLGAVIMTGYPIAYCSVALITFGLLAVLPAGDLHSPYVQWGWRIPFVIGALLAFGFVWWFTKQVHESPAWKEGTKQKSPLRELFRGANRRSFFQVFVLMTGIWVSLNMVAAVLPALLADPVGLDSSQVSIMMVIVYVVVAVAYVVAGVTSQKVGRRPSLIVLGVLTGTVVPACFGLIVSGAVSGLAAITLLVMVIAVLNLSMWGIITTYINERFHTGVRASGYGLGYSLAVIIPSFYAFYQAGLTAFVPMAYTPLILLVIAGVLVVVGAAIGPETRDVDMRASTNTGTAAEVS